MKSQFIPLLFIIFTLGCNNEKIHNKIVMNQKGNTQYSIPILNKNNKQIGFLDSIASNTILPDSTYYVLDTLNILSEKIIIKSEVSLTNTNSNVNNKYFFQRIYEITIHNFSNYSVIKANNTIGVSSYEIFVRKNKSSELEIYKETGWDSIITKIEIGENDYDSFRANLICTREDIIPIKEIINIPEDFNFNENNKKNCFSCPDKYSTEECLRMKMKKENFIWD